MFPVELIALGGKPIDVAADRFAAGGSELELDEVDARQAGRRRQRRQLPRTVSREIDSLQAPLIGDAAVQVAFADDRPQSMFTAERVIDQHDGARIV